jgi:hypothetical protein
MIALLLALASDQDGSGESASDEHHRARFGDGRRNRGEGWRNSTEG